MKIMAVIRYLPKKIVMVKEVREVKNNGFLGYQEEEITAFSAYQEEEITGFLAYMLHLIGETLVSGT